MHLVSRYRYPLMHMMPTDTVVEYLLSAPKVARELQPMHWTFIDAPPGRLCDAYLAAVELYGDQFCQ